MVQATITPESLSKLCIWLLGRERDIAGAVEDFGELKTVFLALIGRRANPNV